jgi:hypothetical protein
MTELSVSIDINAPPARILAILLDVEHWPEWTATVTSVQRMDRGPFGMGSQARIRQPKLLPAVWEVTELDGHSFTWVTRSPGLQITAGHVVEATAMGSKATLSLKFSGFLAPLFARLYRDLSQRYIRIEAEGLKKRSES